MSTLPNLAINAFVEKAITYRGDDCLIWPFAKNAKGYAQSPRFGYIVSRFICKKVHGAPPTPSHHAAHAKRCTSKSCINPNHLRWATQVENFADDHRGENHHLVKLSEEQVLKIRKLWLTINPDVIAIEYGISTRTVRDIVHKRRWAWLEEPSDADLIFATTKPRMKDLFT